MNLFTLSKSAYFHNTKSYFLWTVILVLPSVSSNLSLDDFRSNVKPSSNKNSVEMLTKDIQIQQKQVRSKIDGVLS